MSPKVEQVFGVTLQGVLSLGDIWPLEKESNRCHQPHVPTADLQGGSTPVPGTGDIFQHSLLCFEMF